MSSVDGSVLGATQVFGSAPRNRAFNVVLLAEGFTAAEQVAFDHACGSFVAALRATTPFDQLMHAVNVFRINVESLDSGADDPAAAGGTGAIARTYFDATFGAGNIRRLLVCDAAAALQVAAGHVPDFTVVLVVVNSPTYGGSGGPIATYSLAGGATEIAIHEMGHTAFGLADEYAYYFGGNEPERAQHPPIEPHEPNVTVAATLGTLKWRSVVSPATAVPTMSNPDCSVVDTRPSPVPAGTVGLFEGAHYYHCGAYRPEYACKMQTLGVPFCRVCRDVIRARVAPSQWRSTAITSFNGGVGAATGHPTAYVTADGLHHIVYRGIDDRLYELWRLLPGGWHLNDLTAVSGGPPLAAGDPFGYAHVDGTQHVVYRAADGHVIELWWHVSSGWHNSDLTAVSGNAPAAVSNPTGYALNDGTQHVMYRDAAGHVIELWWQLSSGWHHSDLTAVSGHPPPAAGRPAGYGMRDGTQHVMYRAQTGDIVELWWLAGSGWHNSGLTTIVPGAPAAAGDPFGYELPAGEQHVVYRAVDGRVIELWWRLAGGWRHRDLTTLSGAPAAAGDPTGYVSPAATQHLVFRGHDGHINLLQSDGAGIWTHLDASSASGTTASSASAPAGFALAGGSQYIVYRDGRGDICELAATR